MDIENLPATPDIDNIDLSTMDRGNTIPEKDEPVVEDEKLVKEEPVADEGVENKEEKVDEGDEPDEPARDEKGKFASKGIPKARFDEAVGKEREAREAAERRAADLERQLEATAQKQVQTEQVAALETQIEAMEAKHAELLLDGDTAGAAKVMKDIRMSERQIARAESEAIATQRTSQALEGQRVQTAIARLEADHAPLNPDSDSYDADLVELVLTKQSTLIRSGMAPSAALTEAANTVMARFGKAAPVAPVEADKGLAAAKVVEDRKAAQVKKNLDTMAKQPASLKDSGVDSDKIGATKLPDVKNMTQEEFAALPAATLARMRGDLI